MEENKVWNTWTEDENYENNTVCSENFVGIYYCLYWTMYTNAELFIAI